MYHNSNAWRKSGSMQKSLLSIFDPKRDLTMVNRTYNWHEAAMTTKSNPNSISQFFGRKYIPLGMSTVSNSVISTYWKWKSYCLGDWFLIGSIVFFSFRILFIDLYTLYNQMFTITSRDLVYNKFAFFNITLQASILFFSYMTW